MRLLVTLAFAVLALVLPDLAFAQEGAAATGAAAGNWGTAVGAGLAIGLAGLGCGLGQGLAGSGAVQGIARNPGAQGQIFTPMIVALALIESISLYGLLIGLLLVL